MVRPLRVQVPGGWYHLTARGNERRPIFRSDADYAAFTGLLGELHERFGLRIAAYALMPNHYHLLAVLDRPQLSRAMQWLNLSYGARFNAQHRRSGHLFQGRFHSVLVEHDGEWALSASAYIHLNPVRIASLGLDKKTRAAERMGWLPAPTPAELTERLNVLRTYPWSSYRALSGLAATPAWLDGAELLKRAGGAAAYREFIEARIRQGEPEPFKARVQLGMAYGSETFAAGVRPLASEKADREHRGRKRMSEAPDLKAVIRAVETVVGEPLAAFQQKHGHPGRDLIWWAARRFASIPLSELAEPFGHVDYSTVSVAVARLTRKAGDDRELAGRMAAVQRELSNVKI